MDHAIEFTSVEQLIHCLRIRQRGSDELEVPVFLEQCQPAFFKTHVIVVVDRVQTDHLMTLCQKALRNVKANESSCAGDENAHRWTLVRVWSVSYNGRTRARGCAFGPGVAKRMVLPLHAILRLSSRSSGLASQD